MDNRKYYQWHDSSPEIEKEYEDNGLFFICEFHNNKKKVVLFKSESELLAYMYGNESWNKYKHMKDQYNNLFARMSCGQ